MINGFLSRNSNHEIIQSDSTMSIHLPICFKRVSNKLGIKWDIWQMVVIFHSTHKLWPVTRLCFSVNNYIKDNLQFGRLGLG